MVRLLPWGTNALGQSRWTFFEGGSPNCV